jgi:GDP-L-fucose synthase
VEDMAAGCLFLMNLDENNIRDNLLSYPKPCFVNLGTGRDLTIAELARLIAEVVGYKGKISYDPDKPDGTMQKLQDISRIKKLGWSPSVELSEGLELSYRWFIDHYQQFCKKL